VLAALTGSINGYAKPLRIAMKRLPRIKGWVGGYGKLGVVITDEVWWKPKCTASNDWANG